MRKLSLRFAAALAATLFVSGATVARADDKSEINGLYAKITKAMKAKDLKAIQALGTPDFTSKEPGSPPMDAKTSMKMMEEQFKSTKSIEKMVMKADDIKIAGKNADVTSSYSFKMTVTGPDGKTHTMSDDGIMKDKLVKTPKGWLFKSVETVKTNMKMDGKAMPAAAAVATPVKKAKK